METPTKRCYLESNESHKNITVLNVTHVGSQVVVVEHSDMMPAQQLQYLPLFLRHNSFLSSLCLSTLKCMYFGNIFFCFLHIQQTTNGRICNQPPNVLGIYWLRPSHCFLVVQSIVVYCLTKVLYSSIKSLFLMGIRYPNHEKCL